MVSATGGPGDGAIGGPAGFDIDDASGAEVVAEPVDLDAIDPEAWRPSIPWRPPGPLLLAVAAVPVSSLVLVALIGEHLVNDGISEGLVSAWWTMAVATLVIGVVIAWIPIVAAHVVRGRDGATLTLLERGFSVGVTLVGAIIVLHTVLVSAFVLGIEYAALGRGFPGSVGLIVLAGLASLAALSTAGIAASRAVGRDEAAMILTREEAPGLFDMVSRLADTIGVAQPAGILVGPSMDWWTAAGSTRALDGVVEGTVIHTSLPAMAVLSPIEVEAILADELAHRRGGGLEMGVRLGRAFDRIGSSIAALHSEATGAGAIVATPAIWWLASGAQAIAGVVAERRRESEAAADALAATAVGPAAVATGLLVTSMLHFNEAAWIKDVDDTIAGRIDDPTVPFLATMERSVGEHSATDVILSSLAMSSPSHPMLLTRLRSLDQRRASLELAHERAIDALLADPVMTRHRLLDLLRPRDPRADAVVLNQPRLTAGILGWLLFGLVVAVTQARWVLSGQGLIVAAMLAIPWALFGLVYPWLQREVALNEEGIHVRSWLRRWLARKTPEGGWEGLRWRDGLRAKDRLDTVSISDGVRRVRLWIELWPKAERERLYDALRGRGVPIISRTGSIARDPERHVVAYHLPGRFLLPTLARDPDGRLIEVMPIRSVPVDLRDLSSAVADTLRDAVRGGKRKDSPLEPVQLAAAADVEPGVFESVVRRVAVDASRETWQITVNGEITLRAPLDALRPSDIGGAVLDVLGLPATVNSSPATDDDTQQGSP